MCQEKDLGNSNFPVFFLLTATSLKETLEAENHQTVVDNKHSTDENSATELRNQQMTHKEEEVVIPVEESTTGETGNTKHLMDLENTEIIFVIGLLC